MSNTFAKLKDGSIHVVYSDNIDEETMHLIPRSQWNDEHGHYDAEWICSKEYPYADIVETDTNIVVLNYTPDSQLNPDERIQQEDT